MKDFIARDGDGNVVGKWRRHRKPILSDNFDVVEVEDVNDFDIDYWHDK